MADTREKLVELLKHDTCKGSTYEDCYDCEYDGMQDCFFVAQADHLIANGVTLDNQVSSSKCDYCQEDREGYRKAFGAFLITNPFHGYEWKIGAHHCTPRNIYFCPMCGRKLAEPPKGD